MKRASRPPVNGSTEEGTPAPTVDGKSADTDHGGLERFFTASRDMMGVATVAGRLLQINPAFEQWLGQPQDPSAARNMLDLVDRRDRNAMRRAMAGLGSGGQAVDQVNRSCSRNGCSRWLEWRLMARGNGLMDVVARDITERKESEETLLRARNDVEDEVRRRTEHLEQSASELRALANSHIMAGERERLRVVQLVHDPLQQLIAAALLTLRMVKARGADACLREDLQAVEDMLKDCIATTRSLTEERSPAVLL